MTSVDTITAKVRFPNGRSREFCMWGDELTRYVCQEVLDGTSYPIIQLDFPVNMILDVGANVGAASIYFHTMYPKAIIHAYEPFEGSFNLLQKNAEGLPITCHNEGLSSKSETRRMYGGNIGPVGFNLWGNSGNDEEFIEVTCKDAGNVVTSLQPDILKIDTEGHEVEILEAITQKQRDRISVIYVEYHSERHRRKIDDLLIEHVLYSAKATAPHQGELCYMQGALLNRLMAKEE